MNDKMIDLNTAEVLQVHIRSDSKVVWINVDGVCKLRCANIKNFDLLDQRKKQ